MSTDVTTLTTAQALGRFRKELVEEGVSPELADALTLQASQSLLEDGFEVRNV